MSFGLVSVPITVLRGYELPDGRVILVTDEELRALPLPTARAIELIAYIPAAVDPLRIGHRRRRLGNRRRRTGPRRAPADTESLTARGRAYSEGLPDSAR
ncbi:hypothetical protein OG866_01415 [Streptomyces sp. NBC_00663]|uniref:hypothetical protein n=1 Tax=Streptomyces sp. NBC_00663 TaxID=2975801 RepID=UPI002E315AF9|nr:hypothetical protein [Streptomyces sp. NBC_00663]